MAITHIEQYRKAKRVAKQLGACLAQPCEHCGCRIFFTVEEGKRCAWGWPPAGRVEEVRRLVETTFELPVELRKFAATHRIQSDPMFVCGKGRCEVVQ